MITCQLRKKRDHSFISQDRLDLLSGCVSPNPHLLLFFQFPTFPTHNKNQSNSKSIHSLQFKWEGSHVTCVSYNEDKNQQSQRKYLFIYLLSKWNQPNSTQNQESVVDYRITPCIDPFGIRFLNGISNTFYLIIIQHVYSSTKHFYYFFNKSN